MTATLERAAQVAWRGIRAAVAARMTGAGGKGRVQAVAIYLLVNQCNVPGAVAARVAGCTKQNVSKLLGRIEDLRDDAGFDAALADLERSLEA